MGLACGEGAGDRIEKIHLCRRSGDPPFVSFRNGESADATRTTKGVMETQHLSVEIRPRGRYEMNYQQNRWSVAIELGLNEGFTPVACSRNRRGQNLREPIRSAVSSKAIATYSI